MADRLDRLLPEPQTLRERDDLLASGPLRFVESGLPLALLRPAIDYLIDRCGAEAKTLAAAEAMAERRPERRIGFHKAEELIAEAYELSVTGRGIEIKASSRRGFLYGAVALRQWIAVHQTEHEHGALPGVEIRDQPDFPRRGFLLDISRNKVPKMATLMQLVDLLTDLKLNELQLYMEHTFAYPGHEEVWRNASPLTADQIQQLDGYCRLRCVELVPNQNSFGHLHRWLKHPSYRDLAECPEGVRHAFSDRIEPFSLCPVDPGSLDLLRDLYGKLLPNFTSGRFHVGFDETFEIGRGRSRVACAESGLDGVYLRHLEAVRKLAAEHNRRIEIWADMVIEHRKLMRRIPEDVTLCAWGYEAGHPFLEDCSFLGASGCDVVVCPGTSSWSSYAGRAHNALTNLAEAASAGLATGAAGYLITEWGDRGHLQPLSACYLGLVAGAAFAWNRGAARHRGPGDWSRAIDRWALDEPDAELGEVALALADVYRVTGATQKNGTALFHLIMSPDDGLEARRYRGLSRHGLAKARSVIDSALGRLAHAADFGPEGRRVRDELLWVGETLRLACTVGEAKLLSPFSSLPELPSDVRKELCSELSRLADRRAELWLERNRRGGLAESLHLFGRLERRLGSG